MSPVDHWQATVDELVEENASLRVEVDRLRRMAHTDHLTGLANRRAWDQELKRELARGKRWRHPICLALVDLDGFKAYNDQHGHQAGDSMLDEVARRWRSQIRAIDFLARWGGDEFAVLLPNCPLDQGELIADRLRASVPESQSCTVAIGVWDGEESSEALLGRIDQSLYRAKSRSRLAPVAPVAGS